MGAIGQLTDALLARLAPRADAHACAISLKVSGGAAAEVCSSKRAVFLCPCYDAATGVCRGRWIFRRCA